MALIVILLCLLCAVAFILTRTVIVKIRRSENYSVEIHFPLLAFVFPIKENKERDGKLSFRAYRKIYTSLSILLAHSHLLVENVSLPQDSLFTDPLSQGRARGFFSILLAYIASKAQRISFKSDALKDNDVGDELLLSISLQTRAHRLIHCLVRIVLNILEEKARQN